MLSDIGLQRHLHLLSTTLDWELFKIFQCRQDGGLRSLELKEAPK
jgi:hypothetical protein